MPKGLSVIETSQLTVCEAEMEQCRDSIRRDFRRFGELLRKVRDEKLYLESDPTLTFEAYCERRWDFTRQRAHQMIEASKAVENLSTVVDQISTAQNEWQARNLLHPPKEQPREFFNNEATWEYPYKYTPESELTPYHLERRGEYKSEILQAAREIKAEQAEERRTERIAKVVELAQVAPLNTVGRFPLIYADPPWQYDFISVDAWKVENHYPTMPLDEICALPVGDIATKDAILFLWATAPKLADAMKVVSAWGFTYKTCAIWDKEWTGMGNYFRVQHELLLIATRGSIPPPTTDNRPASIVKHKRSTTHSQKPDVFYDIIEAMYPEFPKVELFARATREGWKSWGNQTGEAI